MRRTGENYNAELSIFSMMAHYVAEKLHLRPNDILDGWSVPELLVAFGHYANEEANRNYNEWKHLDSKTRATIPKPNEYVVYFHNTKEE